MLPPTLVHQILTLERHFICLDISIKHSNGWQVRNLNALRKSIQSLRKILEELPISPEPVCSIIRHNIYNHLFVINGSSQLFLDACGQELEIETTTYLQTILVVTEHIKEILDADRTSVLRRLDSEANLL